MATAVVVPCRLDEGPRRDAWRWVRRQYEEHHPEWEIVTGSGPDGPWRKALAIREAVERTDADRLLIADSDVWCEGLLWAVDRLSEWPWVIPHHAVHRLTQEATQAVLAGGPLEGETTQQPYKGYAGGGFMAVRRDVYEQAPMDPRFVGWGQEDQAWHLALSRIAGQGIRGRAACWHLWHPPQDRVSRVYGSEASMELLNRYQRARTAPDMAALLAEVNDDREDRREPPRSTRAPART